MARKVQTERPQVQGIDPTAVYETDEAAAVLRMCVVRFRKEVKAGRVRVCKRAGRHRFLGKYLLQWVEDGVEEAQKAPEPAKAQDAGQREGAGGARPKGRGRGRARSQE